MIGRCIRNLCGRRWFDDGRVFSNQLARRIDKDGHLARDLILFLYTFAFAIVIISADGDAVGILDLGLFVISVENKRPRLIASCQITRDIAVLVVLEICACKPIGVRINRRSCRY